MPWVSGLLSLFLPLLSLGRQETRLKDENVQKFKKKCAERKKKLSYIFFNNYYTIILPYTAAYIYTAVCIRD